MDNSGLDSYVLITGAVGGIGKTFAAECASRGWNLFLTDIRSDLLEPLAAGLTRLYTVQVQFFPCDLTDACDRDRLWQEIRHRGLRFHFLINLAGTEFEGPFCERSVEELRTLLRLNIESAVEMSSRVLAHRAPHEKLCILNVSSLAGFYPMPVKAVYAASKRFLLDFSLALRQELRGSNVNVTALCPAGLPTNPRSIRGIQAQGWVGQLTMVGVGQVAARAVDDALAGRAVYVPGILNQLISLLSRLLPPTWMTAAIWHRWRRLRTSHVASQQRNQVS